MVMSAEQNRIAEVAKDTLESIMEMMDVSGLVEASGGFPVEGADDPESSITLDIQGDDLGILIGRRGQTLSSLQYIVRIIVSHQLGATMPIIIDVEGYKRRRCESLHSMALRIAEQVSNRNAPFNLEPMTAFDRRVVHLALADHPDVITESTGIGEFRKVVVIPKQLGG